jgi:hypothetical protein
VIGRRRRRKEQARIEAREAALAASQAAFDAAHPYRWDGKIPAATTKGAT